MTMTKSEIANVIRKAADIVEHQPAHPAKCWADADSSGAYFVDGKRPNMPDGTVCYCAGGAIAHVLTGVEKPYWYQYVSSDVAKAIAEVGCTHIQHFNDGHSGKETAAYMRSLADAIAPKVPTLTDIMSNQANGNWNASLGADETERTTEAYRRRLLAWAEALETEFIGNHWNYRNWSCVTDEQGYKNNWYANAMPDADAPISSHCGTAACAAGWLYLMPEAKRAGAGKGAEWDGHKPDARVAWTKAGEFFGIPPNVYQGITFGHGEDLAELGAPIVLNLHSSTPKDVAAVIRWAADKYQPTPKYRRKTPRVEKPGTKRYMAKLLRDGAKFLETHKHGRCYLYRDGAYCAMGAIAAGAIGEVVPTGDRYANDRPLRAFLDSAFGGSWYSGQSVVLGDLVPVALTAVTGGRFGYRNEGCVTKVNDDPKVTKEEVMALLRTMAYMLEHGGKLPKQYAAFEHAAFEHAAFEPKEGAGQ